MTITFEDSDTKYKSEVTVYDQILERSFVSNKFHVVSKEN